MEKMDDTEKVLENNANSDINFDTSVLQEKNETYSSLTDTYGIDLFTDQYEEKIQEVHLKEYDAYQLHCPKLRCSKNSDKGTICVHHRSKAYIRVCIASKAASMLLLARYLAEFQEHLSFSPKS